MKKKITCPEHPAGDHKAILYCWPHEYAGIWECPENQVSDTHDHQEKEVTQAIDGLVYKCAGCGVTLDGDPELDKAEAKSENQAAGIKI